ncbi:MAG: gliding motility-associated C-terminal domain-containing protein [Flavobacteriales bacterium]|nr:gliding motility-associated C-terminal domain-containing protein [Flavobacteriales bacterium]
MSPSTATGYEFTVTDTCGVAPVTTTAQVLFIQNPALVVNIGADITATCIDQIDISSNVVGGFGPYEYSWSSNGGSPFATTPDVSFTDNEDLVVTVTVTDACDITASDNLNVTYPPVPVNVNLGTDITATCLDNNQIIPVVGGGVGTYSYSWTNGSSNVGSASSLSITVSENSNISLTVEDQCGNTGSDALTINIPAVPVLLDLGPDQTVTCSDQTLIDPAITGGVGNYSYEWSLQSGVIGVGATLMFQTDQTETVILSVEDQCGNVADDDVVFTIPQLALNVDAGSDQTILCTDPVNLEGLVSGGVGGYTYAWQVNGMIIGNGSTFSGQFINDTQVELVVTDECGNENTDQVNISIPPVPVNAYAGEDLTVTCLDLTNLLGTATGGVGSFNYAWSDADGLITPTAIANVTTTSNHTYILSVVDECGNVDTDEVNVFVPPVPIEMTMTPDASICLNDAVAIGGLGTGGVGTISYYWEHDHSTLETTTVSPESSTTYVLVAEDQCGNTATGETVVVVSQITPNFMAEYIDDFTVAFTNASENDVWVEWTFPDGTTSNEDNPVHTFNTVDTWEVTLTAWAAAGCRRSITQEYFPTGNVFVPNTFTPDHDGINDVFFCYGHDLASFEITIFNKWGEVVYHSTDITMPWDGSTKGGDYYVPDGVYPYIMKAMDKKDHVIERKGSVQIIR